jgi:hypothetical protein
MQCKHGGSIQPKKFQTAFPAGKQMAMVFWNMKGILMMEWLSQETTLNSFIYCSILMYLCQKIEAEDSLCGCKLSNNILLSGVCKSLHTMPEDCLLHPPGS